MFRSTQKAPSPSSAQPQTPDVVPVHTSQTLPPSLTVVVSNNDHLTNGGGVEPRASVTPEPLSAEGLMLSYEDQTLFSSATLLADVRLDADSPLPALDAHLDVRALKLSDYDRGYALLLGQLTEVGDLTKERFAARFDAMRRTRPAAYYVLVVHDTSVDRLVASATLTLEWKFIHAAGSRGRVEDVVVDGAYRGRRLGDVLVRHLTAMARRLGCYKVSLECKDRLVDWYARFGYSVDEGNNFMVRRFDKETTAPPPGGELDKPKI